MAPDISIPQARRIVVDTRGAQIVQEESPATRDSRGIYLPHYIEPVSHIAIDIGGSLAKVIYFTRSSTLPKTPPPEGETPFVPPQIPVSTEASPSRRESSSGSSSTPNGQESATEHRQPKLNGALTPASLNTASSPISASPSVQSPTDAASSSTSTTTTSTQAPTPSLENRQPKLNGALTPTSLSPHLHSSRTFQSQSRNQIQKPTLPTHPKLRRSSLPPPLPGGLLNFARFETSNITDLITFLQDLISTSAIANRVSLDRMKGTVKVMATGGGAHMYYDLLVSELGVEVRREEEMACLILGLGFIAHVPEEVFWFSEELVYKVSHPPPSSSASASLTGTGNGRREEEEPLPRPSPTPPQYQVTFATPATGLAEPHFPCLVVNIGSGVSIVKVDEEGRFERVSGTSLGGGTLWGLLSLLTDAESFDEMLLLSEKGDNAAVDMLVGDIYGSDYSKIGLKSSTIASSFGKVFKKGANSEERKKRFKQEDIARSLLYAISNNIGHVAYMNAAKYGLDRVFFGGCFIRGHAATISTLSYAIRFWSKGTMRACFLRHEGFLGAIGAWIKNVEPGEEDSVPNGVDGHET